MTDHQGTPPALVEPSAVDDRVIPLHCVGVGDYERWLSARSDAARGWLATSGFRPDDGAVTLLPGSEPETAEAALIVAEAAGRAGEPWPFAGLPFGLPQQTFRLAETDDGATRDPALAQQLALGWALGAYRFGRFKSKADRSPARLIWPDGVDRLEIMRLARATHWVRDLVNTPAGELGPEMLAAEATAMAEEFAAAIEVIEGDDLIERNYPMIHAVGRASTRAPRLIDLTWGDPEAPRVLVVGKGVCFDSGGYDLKPAGGMLIMKKDMGGAAHALALAQLIMASGLPVRLRLLVPAVENLVAGNAFKPLDVLKSRKGLTVEIGNTDAEGRLILADALTAGMEDDPAIAVDFATLTGAGRVALGQELPALFCNDDATADLVLAEGERIGDPLWRLPLWQPYNRLLRSSVADVSNVGEGQFGGAITAALFLERFVSPGIPWIHIDQNAWNGSDRPGRPKGGEAMGLRAVHAMLAKRFGA